MQKISLVSILLGILIAAAGVTFAGLSIPNMFGETLTSVTTETTATSTTTRTETKTLTQTENVTKSVTQTLATTITQRLTLTAIQTVTTSITETVTTTVTTTAQTEPTDNDTLTFIVSVPPTTPPDDTIILHYWPPGSMLVLTSIGNHQYRGDIDRSKFFENASVQPYTYSRGGMNIFREKRINGDEETRKAYEGESPSVIRDTVYEWKWFPSQPLEEEDIPSLAGVKNFEPRPDFWKGVQFVDYWDPNFPYQYNSTINHMKAFGYTWIEIAPPWDIKSEEPPKISGVDVDVPSFPEEELRRHIRVFKDTGFKVMLRIQICCNRISSENRSVDWWQTWYDEVEKFVEFHAVLAREEGVDAIVIFYPHFGLPLEDGSPSFASERWSGIIDTAKSSQVPVGIETTVDGVGEVEALPWPLFLIDFADDLDFIGVLIGRGFITNPEPTQEDFNRGMREERFAQIDYLYQTVGKPVVITGVWYGSYKGAALIDYYPDAVDPWQNPEDVTVEYSAEEQAMIYEALMREVAERGYVRGIFPFGYWYLDAPLTLDPSIRGKMAERILSGWFNSIPDSSKHIGNTDLNQGNVVEQRDEAVKLGVIQLEGLVNHSQVGSTVIYVAPAFFCLYMDSRLGLRCGAYSGWGNTYTEKRVKGVLDSRRD